MVYSLQFENTDSTTYSSTTAFSCKEEAQTRSCELLKVQ